MSIFSLTRKIDRDLALDDFLMEIESGVQKSIAKANAENNYEVRIYRINGKWYAESIKDENGFIYEEPSN